MQDLGAWLELSAGKPGAGQRWGVDRNFSLSFFPFLAHFNLFTSFGFCQFRQREIAVKISLNVT